MNILVTGGAGYIGSFMVDRLITGGYHVSVADTLERGDKQKVNPQAELLQGNIGDKAFLKDILRNHDFDAVIHFAGYISMAESMQNPSLYFENNTFTVVPLLEAMHEKNIKKFIFSSTAGVYGNPLHTPIKEDHPTNPTNPYGESKLMLERILIWYEKIYGINFTSLRYFNAAGAALDGKNGENHTPESHIIPNAIKAVLDQSEFSLYGTDYNTPDGTCIRDYIHVLDLIEAHVLALEKLQESRGGFIYNVGTGKGYSNKEVLEMVKTVSGRDFTITQMERRPGDADVLVADPKKIQDALGFSPKYSDLETIVKTAWQWHSSNHASKS